MENCEVSKKFFVYKQIPKPSRIGHLKIALNEKGDAFVMSDSGVVDRLFRARVEWIGADGIFISGVEETGEFFPDGRPVVKFQEWFCRYED